MEAHDHLVPEPDAQRLRHANATVVDAAVAASDQETFRSKVESSFDKFADAVAGGSGRVALIARHQGQARSSRHLDDGSLRAPPTQDAEE